VHSLSVLTERWRGAKAANVLPPAEPADILATFAAAGSIATSDVVFLYMQLGGMCKSSAELWRLWSLAEISTENTARSSSSGVLFSDSMLDAWCYRLKPNANDTSAVLIDYFDGQDPRPVASSLANFFNAYVSEPHSVGLLGLMD
jgi:hypothetical protein